MKRRTFFKSVLSLSVAPSIAPPSIAALREVVLQTSPVAGFQYHRGEQLWADLRPGQPLELLREPLNRFDPRAIALAWRGEKLGYVPRRENTAPAQLLDAGVSLRARIVELRSSADPWERIRVALLLDLPA